MEKRLFIAVLISIAFLMAWGTIMPRLFPDLARKNEIRETLTEPDASDTSATPTTAEKIEPESAAGSEIESRNEEPGAIEDSAIEDPAIEESAMEKEPERVVVRAEREEIVEVRRARYVARFTNRGAQLVSFELRNYREHHHDGPVDLVRPRPATATDFPFSVRSADRAFERSANEGLYRITRTSAGETETLTFEFSDESGLAVTKEFSFPADLEFEFSISAAGTSAPWRMTVGPGIGQLDPTETANRFLVTGDGIIQEEGSFDSLKRTKVDEPESFGVVDFAGIADNYFVTVIKPVTASGVTFQPTELMVEGEEDPRKDLILEVGAADDAVAGRAFFGPKKADLLEQYDLEAALQFGMFGFISRLLLTALLWVNKLTGNYGWAIVVLTFLIKIALFPLQHKSIVSMKKMQKLQPKMNAIRDKYKKAKTDPEQRQKMNTEMMKLYQREKINPMSGCFPILLQLPILWAFYMLLGRAIELRGAPWIGWITDLSVKDPFYITPILMTITMFIQQWITPTAADPTQRKIFLMMPIIFGWLFKEFPAGLVLYWLVQNILTIIQQSIMNRWWKEHPEELEKGAA